MRILVSGSTAVVRDVATTHAAALGHLLTPQNGNTPASAAKTGLPWSLDNGAFRGFEPERFRRKAKAAVGLPNLLWVVAPDVVGSARGTLKAQPTLF